MSFAAELRSRGIAASEVMDDLAQLWYGGLQSQLQQFPAAIAGLTGRATLFCLEELTRSLNMQVRYRIEHHIDSHGRVQHDAIGPVSVIEAVRDLPSVSGFGRSTAVLASRFDPRCPSETLAQKRTGPFSPEGITSLVSWVIA